MVAEGTVGAMVFNTAMSKLECLEHYNKLIADVNDLDLSDEVKIIVCGYLESAYSIGKAHNELELDLLKTTAANQRDRIADYQQRLHNANLNRKQKDVAQIQELTDKLLYANERITDLQNKLSYARGEYL